MPEATASLRLRLGKRGGEQGDEEYPLFNGGEFLYLCGGVRMKTRAVLHPVCRGVSGKDNDSPR